jgi:hypothetical protein
MALMPVPAKALGLTVPQTGWPWAHVSYWPIATDRILVADRRFRGITDMAGSAAGRTRTRMTQLRHRRADFAVMHSLAY